MSEFTLRLENYDALEAWFSGGPEGEVKVYLPAAMWRTLWNRNELLVAFPTVGPACAACGSYEDVAQRGWLDDGDPMPTCASCGSPEHASAGGGNK